MAKMCEHVAMQPDISDGKALTDTTNTWVVGVEDRTHNNRPQSQKRTKKKSKITLKTPVQPYLSA